MANTQNLDLVKPAGTDHALISVINQNFDKIDNFAGKTNTSLAGVQDGIAIVSNGDTHAAIASGQFVYVKNHGSLAEGLYRATAAIATDAALSTSNLAADSSGGMNALKAEIDTANGNLGNLRQQDGTIINVGNADLNNRKITSFVYVGGSGSNLPVSGTGGYVTTYALSDSLVKQEFFAVDSNRTFVRYLRNGSWSNWEEQALASNLVTYVVDEPAVTSSGDGTKTYTVTKSGLYLILVRGNASTASTAPTVTITDGSGVTATQGGSVGGSVFIYKLAQLGANAQITVKVTNFTGSGTYNNYSRITILRLGS